MREHEGLHASSGILYNHESERRPERFVTRRISRAAAAIALGLQDQLTLGSLDAVRDWSFAGDIVRGAWLMLQQERADDYVLASGVAHTVADLARTAFACVDLDFERYVRVDPALVRPHGADAERGRSRQGTRAAGLDAAGELRAARRADGQRGPALAGGCRPARPRQPLDWPSEWRPSA